uniref:Caspase-8 n=1 Tax=Periophthalmus magnuspinnatus TaxID=409849 RepID=A0A3B3Z8P3_9GOBI
MDFQRVLLQIGQSLSLEELKALAFLCRDVSQRRLNSLELFSDLCSSLSDQDLLSPDNPQLLQELLLTIQRPRLLRYLQQTHPGPMTQLISPYRSDKLKYVLLYNLSEDITDEDLRNIKFLLNQNLPRRKLDESVTTLELFMEMEHMDLLSEFNLDLLQEIFQSVCPVLNEKITRYKEQGIVQNIFQWLGFDVEVHHDCTREYMLSVMEKLSSRDHRDMDCVVCCILSHGLEGGVLGVDGQNVPIKQLTMFLNGSKCPSLVDKPKIFFIQACQGVLEQQAVRIETDDPTPCIESDAAKVDDSIPADADFLLGMATVPSFVSYRERKSGTWFIQALCKNLIQELDLVSILTKVNADVSQKTGYQYGPKKQMPQPAFSLRKKVIFPVPSACPPRLWQ